MEDIVNPLVEFNIEYAEQISNLVPPTMDVIKNAICAHQKLLVEFIFETTDFVDKIRKTRQLGKLKEEMRKLFFVYFFDKRTEACDLSNRYLCEYFEKDREHAPRITLKGLRKSDKHVIDYYRSLGDPLPDSYSFHLEDNTAFSRVSAEKVPYHCADIPTEAKAGYYRNRRLIPEKVARYAVTETTMDGRSFTINECISKYRDRTWEECWAGYPESGCHQVSPRSCYKSTLVIPVALSHINLSTKKKLKISADFNSALLAYLCFDDVCIDYFNIPADESVGYIFSDFLSSYLLMMNYIEYNVLSKQISRLNREVSDWKNA